MAREVHTESRLNNGRVSALILASWLLLLTATLGLPAARQSTNRDDDLVRFSVRLALLYYGAAAACMLQMSQADWADNTRAVVIARWLWTLACVTYIIHLGTAFHFYHHWSHADAVEHTQAVSGFGQGIYFSHLFTLAWTADVLTWWIRPASYAQRAPWIGWLLHGFMVFIVFNATVVYETGPTRWAGLLLFGILGALYIASIMRSKKRS